MSKTINKQLFENKGIKEDAGKLRVNQSVENFKSAVVVKKTQQGETLKKNSARQMPNSLSKGRTAKGAISANKQRDLHSARSINSHKSCQNLTQNSNNYNREWNPSTTIYQDILQKWNL